MLYPSPFLSHPTSIPSSCSSYHSIFLLILPVMSSCSDESDDLDPCKVIEECAGEQSDLDSFARRLATKIKATFTSQPTQRQFGPRKSIRRDHGGAHQRLVEDYFAKEPLYPNSMFRTRFRMNKCLFLRIVNSLGQWSPYFTYRVDCAG